MARRVLVSVAEYAEHRGVSRQAVYDAITEGRVHFEPGVGKIDRDRADREWINPVRPDAAKLGADAQAAQRLLVQANAQRAVWKARREELAHQRESRQLEESIRLAGAEQARRTQDRLLAIPARVAPAAAMKPRAEVERLIRDEIRRALADLAGIPAAEPRPVRRKRA